MKSLVKLLLLTFVSLYLAGCATIITSTSQEVTFTSTPDEVSITINGKAMGKTPLTYNLKKKKDQTVSFEKDGYKTQTRQLTTSLEPWFWGNIILGGLIGSTTDSVSGGIHEYSPNQYHIVMEPQKGMASTDSNNNGETVSFIISGYKNIIEELNSHPAEYISSLLKLLKVDENNKEDAIKKIQMLSELHVDIASFAKEVVNYFNDKDN